MKLVPRSATRPAAVFGAALAAAVLAALLPLAAAGQPPAGEPADEVFEEIDVREEETLLDLPPSGVDRLLGDPDAAQFLVAVGGARRPAVKVEPLAAGDAHVVLYFDLTGLDPLPPHLAALTLAERAGALTAMGEVEVVVADPEPAVTLAPTREARALNAALADVAAILRKRPRPAYTVRSGGDPERWRRAAGWVEASPARGPRFLFLVTQGFAPTPEELDALGDQLAVRVDGAAAAPAAAPPREGEAGERVAAVLDAARRLAAAGWVTVPVMLRGDELRPKHARPIELYDPTENEPTIAVDYLPLIRMILAKLRGRSGAPPPDDEAAFRPHTTPENAALVALARETGGELLGQVEAVDWTLDDLKGRWRLWYPVEDGEAAQAGGAPAPLEVIFLGDGRSLHTRRWTRVPG